VTRRMYQAITAYWRNPGSYTLHMGAELIVAGHLDPSEVDMVERAIKEYREKVAMTS
jgi:hypothetical protein